LRQRLEGRGKDDAEIIARRMRDAVTEMRHYPEFDYVVVNEDFGVALNELKSIVIANRLVQARQSHNLNTLLTDLLA